jgi:hypothetical protein
MNARGTVLTVVAALIAAGCASGPPFIEAAQPAALQTAQRRAQFEWNCPAATAQVLSQEMVTSPLQYTRFAPPERAEYTVGVAGCGQRHTYLVICTDGGGCIAAAGRPFN